MSRPRIPVLAALAFAPSLLTAARGVRRSLGAGTRRFDYTASPQFADGLFHNRLATTDTPSGSTAGMAAEFATKGRKGKPRQPVRLVTPDLAEQAADLAATWLGHATVLLELEGRWVLTDPVWSERVSPSRTVGPRRNHPVPMPLADLPRLSAVLISHDHYDHLDTATIETLLRTQDMPFVVPLGIGEHLSRWGVPDDRIVELDWDQAHVVDGLTFTCTEARHFSGRSLGNNTTLWASWVLAGEQRRVFFGGDSGYTPAFAGIGERYGPFDLTILPIGAYDVRWPDVHMDPAEAVQAHLELRGATLLPIHWATFDLAFHEWADPVEWVVKETANQGVALAVPAPGARFEPAGELPAEPWWQASL
ncbi:MAG: putative secreted metallo-beta-lactamase superfamily protein [Marmoricola sp.]|nr:putative secreted metallo-beta-lactamase superfamily protein [Marmoricola sp.]